MDEVWWLSYGHSRGRRGEWRPEDGSQLESNGIKVQKGSWSMFLKSPEQSSVISVAHWSLRGRMELSVERVVVKVRLT